MFESFNTSRNEIAEHKRTMSEEYDRDFIDTYLKKIKKLEGSAEPVFSGACQKWCYEDCLGFLIKTFFSSVFVSKPGQQVCSFDNHCG